MDKVKLSIACIFLFMIIAIILNQSPLFWLFFVASLIFIPISISLVKEEIADTKKKLTKVFNETIKNKSLSPSQQYLSDDCSNGIVLDEEQGKIALLYKVKDADFYKIMAFPFSKIVEIEVNQDGDTVTKVSKGSLVGGALVGGILAGGIGSIIGALGSSKTSSEEVKNINIRIIFNDLNTPTFTFNFLNETIPISKNDEKYKKIINDVDHWYGVFSVLIKRNQEQLNVVSK